MQTIHLTDIRLSDIIIKKGDRSKVKNKHIAALAVSLICTLVAIALSILVLVMFIQSSSLDASDLSNEEALPGASLFGFIAMFQIAVSLNIIGALNSLMAIFLAASLMRKYSKKTDVLCFSIVGIDCLLSLFFIGALTVLSI